MSSRIEQIIEEIEEYIDRDCKYQPLSTTKIIVNKEHLDELLRELRMKTPDEIKRYQKIISNRDAILADAQAKADAMIEDAQVQTTELVSEHEIMQQAYAQANEIVTQATAQAQEIIDTLKAETLTHTGDAMPVLRMEFSQQNNDDYYSEGAVCVTDKDVKTLALIKKYANIVPKAVSAKNVKLVTLSIYLPDKDFWQGVQVTDRADIDALLKNAVNIDAMNLYGSDAMAYGIMQQFARSNVSVTYTDEKAMSGMQAQAISKRIIRRISSRIPCTGREGRGKRRRVCTGR